MQQCNYAFGSGFPAFGQTFPNFVPHCNGANQEIVGEGEVASVVSPDGSIQMYFVPVTKWCPSFWNNPNFMKCPTYCNSNPGTWLVRSISNPIPLYLFQQRKQMMFGCNMPPPAPVQVQPCLCDNPCNVGPPAPSLPELQFHNDGWTSTTDLHYFCLRPNTCVGVQVPLEPSCCFNVACHHGVNIPCPCIPRDIAMITEGTTCMPTDKQTSVTSHAARIECGCGCTTDPVLTNSIQSMSVDEFRPKPRSSKAKKKSNESECDSDSLCNSCLSELRSKRKKIPRKSNKNQPRCSNEIMFGYKKKSLKDAGAGECVTSVHEQKTSTSNCINHLKVGTSDNKMKSCCTDECKCQQKPKASARIQSMSVEKSMKEEKLTKSDEVQCKRLESKNSSVKSKNKLSYDSYSDSSSCSCCMSDNERSIEEKIRPAKIAKKEVAKKTKPKKHSSKKGNNSKTKSKDKGSSSNSDYSWCSSSSSDISFKRNKTPYKSVTNQIKNTCSICKSESTQNVGTGESCTRVDKQTNQNRVNNTGIRITDHQMNECSCESLIPGIQKLQKIIANFKPPASYHPRNFLQPF